MDKIHLRHLVLGPIRTNTYLIENRERGECLVVDPADEADRIREEVDRMGARPAAILLTHGHFDHIGAAEALRKIWQIPVCAHEAEEELLADAALNLSVGWGGGLSLMADRLVRDREILDLAGLSVRVIHTPGHTKGSCCYYLEKEGLLFSGDTLFALSYGRTDFPTGSSVQMQTSVRRLVTGLPGETSVYPGHEGFTSIEREKRYNPLA